MLAALPPGVLVSGTQRRIFLLYHIGLPSITRRFFSSTVGALHFPVPAATVGFVPDAHFAPLVSSLKDLRCAVRLAEIFFSSLGSLQAGS